MEESERKIDEERSTAMQAKEILTNPQKDGRK